GDTITPHLIVVDPLSPTPRTVVDNVKLPETPAKGPLPPPQPLLHPRQRNVFKKLGSIFKFLLHSRASLSLKRSPHSPSLQSPVPLLAQSTTLAADSDRTQTEFHGAFSDILQAKLGNRAVAVKALRVVNMDGPDEIRMMKRLAREIYVWAELDHPQVLELLGFAFDNRTPCLISPWCENGTLQEYLQKNPGANRRLLVRQIAEGLKYLHSQTPPIVHGDFKTTNILVTDQHMAKICGFGGSKRLERINTGFTTTGLVLATIRYCAPEILRDGQHHTLNSDVYSFACVALETMTDKSPFWKILNVVGVITRVVVEKQTPSPEDHPGLEDPMWELLRRCWSCEPLDRPTMIDVCRT
ncbi:hypothetical protein FRC01_012083, partial [Tulasnella sp. 417]